MDGLIGAFDCYRIEEAYNWRDDIMEITRRIVLETDEARLNNIAEHFEVDLSEIREFLGMKRRKMQGHQTNADRIRAMTDEELDKFLGEVQWDVANYCGGVTQKQEYPVPEQRGAWLDWLKQEAQCTSG